MLVSFVFLVLLCVSAESFLPPKVTNAYEGIKVSEHNTLENGIPYWRDQALSTLDWKLGNPLNTNRAKNIILFLGDGLSVPTITAARIYKGQQKKRSGEEEKLSFESFPYTGLSKTYCVNSQVADSACTATAYLCGVKTNIRAIGVSANVNITDCENAKLDINRPSSIAKWAQDAGKATGIVTNTRVTHASPAGAYAHVPYREMEDDANVANITSSKFCDFDIAQQLVMDEPGKNFKVILGGGRNKFLPQFNFRKEHGAGTRLQNDLIHEWKKDKLNRKENAVYVTDLYGLNMVKPGEVDYLLGLFSPEHMSYNSENIPNEPPLSKMTETAIKLLQKEKNGFFLFVEGGKIDMAHHETWARTSLDETVEFAKAIEIAANLTSEEDTLIVVTADHAHTMSFSGYPVRGFDILGKYGKAEDNLLYSTLSYANGPGYRPESAPGIRYNLEEDDMKNFQYRFPALVPRNQETHGGDDVAVYARGPWAHLFSGNYEQNYIPIAMAYSAQIGPPNSRNNGKNSSEMCHLNWTLILVPVLCLLFKNLLRYERL